MGKIIGIVFLLFAAPLWTMAQNNGLHSKKIELGFCVDPIQGGSGIMLKAKKRIYNRQHLEGYAGIAGQYHRNTEKKFSESIDGGNTDLGVYLLTDWLVYPFSAKHIFIGAEAFAGMNNFSTKGTLTLPDYELTQTYSHNYTYFNYGLGLSIGYDFGRITTNVFANASLKGMTDNGRFRPMDNDSKGFAGVSVGFKW